MIAKDKKRKKNRRRKGEAVVVQVAVLREGVFELSGGEGGGGRRGVSQDYGVSKETEKLMNCQRSVREENSAAREPV